MPVVFNPFTGNLDLIDNTAAAGSDTQVQFNDGGVLGGDSGLVFNKTTNALTGGAFIPTSSSVPTNGVYLPSANTVALSTNGTGRLFVDASGNVGIGTSAPGALFHTVNTSAGAATLGAVIQNNSATANTEVRLGFSPNTSPISDNRYAYIGAINVLGSTDNSLTFGTGLGAPATERMRIDSSGRVGIGTSSPGSLLSLYAGASAEYFRGGGNGVTTRDLVLSASTGTNAGDTHTINASGSSGRLILSTVSSPRMTVDSSGRVGIGTTSPAYQLQLATDSAGKPSTNTWTIVSDERIKEEIELADLDLCYEAVKNIPLKRFKWKDEVYTEEQAYDRRKLGWIAQDVEAVFPKAVRQHEFKYNQVFEEVVIPAVPAELDDDGNVITEEQPERIEKGELISEDIIEDCRDLNSDQIYAAMYGAIQKLISKVELLEAEVAALKG